MMMLSEGILLVLLWTGIVAATEAKQCVKLYKSLDRTGTPKVICAGDSDTSAGSWNDQVNSYELDCTERCYFIVWGGGKDDYSYPPSPFMFDSVSTPSGSFTNAQVGGSGASDFEIGKNNTCMQTSGQKPVREIIETCLRVKNCVKLYNNLDQTGTPKVICVGDSVTNVGDWNDKVNSYEFDCSQHCYLVVWGGDVDDYQWTPGPLLFDSVTEPKGSFTNAQVGGSGASNFEIALTKSYTELVGKNPVKNVVGTCLRGTTA